MKITIPIERKKGNRLARTETVQVRFDPRMRYSLELASRFQRRSVSSFVECAADAYLASVIIDVDPALSSQNTSELSMKQLIDQLWDVDEIVRFVRLAELAPKLLTYEEEVIWRFISATSCFSIIAEDGTVKINIKLVRLLWSELLNFANTGHFDFQVLADKADVLKAAVNLNVSDEKLALFFSAWKDLWANGDTSEV
jgi:hypothetical protein